MSRQTKKQALSSTTMIGKDVVIWKGQTCEIVGNEDVQTSSGGITLCAKIRIIGMPIEKALRLVPIEELSKEF